MTHSIQRILGKLSSANVHLNPPAEVDEVLEFERSNQVQLPPDYREFLVTAGNGGKGPPKSGWCPLNQIPRDFDASALDPSKPFPFSRQWIWEDDEESEEGQLQDIDHGVLILGTDGCGQYWCLVVNGPEYGRIWMLSDVGILPLEPRMSFTEWYEAWLDGETDWWNPSRHAKG